MTQKPNLFPIGNPSTTRKMHDCTQIEVFPPNRLHPSLMFPNVEVSPAAFMMQPSLGHLNGIGTMMWSQSYPYLLSQAKLNPLMTMNPYMNGVGSTQGLLNFPTFRSQLSNLSQLNQGLEQQQQFLNPNDLSKVVKLLSTSTAQIPQMKQQDDHMLRSLFIACRLKELQETAKFSTFKKTPQVAPEAFAETVGSSLPEETKQQSSLSKVTSNADVASRTSKKTRISKESTKKTSAGNKKRIMEEISSIAASSPSKKRCTNKRKPADMPRRPLSAYNLFFAEERKRILSEIDGEKKVEKGASSLATVSDDKKETSSLAIVSDDEENLRTKSPALSSNILQRPLLPSEQKRRPHRKTHGKISFQLLAKKVGQRWKALPEHQRDYYKMLAKEDLKRQKLAMEKYNKCKDNKVLEKGS